MYWENHEELMRACTDGEDHLFAVLEEIMGRSTAEQPKAPADIEALKPTSSVFVSTSQPSDESMGQYSVVVNLTGEYKNTGTNLKKNMFGYKLFPGKKGAKHLREVLPCLRNRLLERERWLSEKILIILPPEDADGVAAACAIFILTWFFDEEGKPKPQDQLGVDVDKQTVQRRIAWWVVSHGESNISRSSLQSVNSVLMDYR